MRRSSRRTSGRQGVVTMPMGLENPVLIVS